MAERVQARRAPDEDAVRDVIHLFNAKGPGRAGPSGAGRRPSPPDR